MRYAVEKIAPVASAQGHRVRVGIWAAGANPELIANSPEYKRQMANGWAQEILEVSEAQAAEILAGKWNGHAKECAVGAAYVVGPWINMVSGEVLSHDG